MRRQQEHNDQKEFFNWCDLTGSLHPRCRDVLGRFFAVPNGGHRNKATAGKLKAEGVKRGILDVFNLTRSPQADGDFYAGLILEFKSDTGRLSDEQRDWKAHFEAQGYRVEVPRSWIEAALITIDYFGWPEELKKNLPLHRLERPKAK